MKTLTKAQVNKKYQNIYVSFSEKFDYSTKATTYQILKTSKTVCENMTLGQDVGTPLEYTR